jgi:hypothetical protein
MLVGKGREGNYLYSLLNGIWRKTITPRATSLLCVKISFHKPLSCLMKTCADICLFVCLFSFRHSRFVCLCVCFHSGILGLFVCVFVFIQAFSVCLFVCLFSSRHSQFVCLFSFRHSQFSWPGGGGGKHSEDLSRYALWPSLRRQLCFCLFASGFHITGKRISPLITFYLSSFSVHVCRYLGSPRLVHTAC